LFVDGWYNTTMLEGKCPKCGKQFYGLALANPRYQMCEACGSGLDIIDGGISIRGYSPFNADNISVRADSNTASRENDID